MTTTYDPFDPRYFDQADLRQEMTRVYDLCHGCRLCFKFCSAFPTLFEAIDRHDDQDAAKLTQAEQDQVVSEVGRDLVRVLERNRISCELPEGQMCCGAPWLHSGDVDNFRRQGRRNVTVLAEAIRAGQQRGEDPAVVVPQPTCSYVLKKDYPDYLGGDPEADRQVAEDADLVAAHTYDAAEYLMKVHKTEGSELDRDFTGEVPETVTYHAACHLRAQNIGLRGRDLLKLMGAKVTVVAECSGIDGTWGYRQENYERSRRVARKMATAIERADSQAVAGDCQLANGGIVQETGRQPVHPVSMLARAYGIPQDDDHVHDHETEIR